MRRTRPIPNALFMGCTLTAAGCNAFDPAPDAADRTVLVVPEDAREPHVAASAPLPVSGGTLLSLGAGNPLAAADPSRDRISFVGSTGVGHVELERGSEPGRLADMGQGRVAAVLRGSGEVLALDSDSRQTLWRQTTCAAPRGVAYSSTDDALHVACVDGTLTTLAADDGSVVEQLQLDSDLRDVVVADGGIYVSRFRAAEVLFVYEGQLERRIPLPDVTFADPNSGVRREMKPTVAWKMLASPTTGVTVVHQRATTDPVATEPNEADDEDSAASSLAANPYGGGPMGSGCDSIVQPAVSVVQVDGSVRTSHAMSRMTLVVDLAYLPDGEHLVVANAGPSDPDSPLPSIQTLGPDGDRASPGIGRRFGAGAGLFSSSELFVDASSTKATISCVFDGQFGDDAARTAVALHGQELVTQQALDAQLTAFQVSELRTRSPRVTRLGGAPLRDTGHDLFHLDTGSGISCASCHPEGTDDGHVWVFEGLGPRRTQNLAVPLADTAPYHWDGELESVSSLMDEVFVKRMGGVFQSKARLDALERWLFVAPQPVRTRIATDGAVTRGQTLFESTEVGCSSCHSGAALTNNTSHDVGTGESLQVPSLVGISSHPPYMHDGCAETLAERFEDPECGGGDAHGKTSQLDAEQLSDLVAYLESL